MKKVPVVESPKEEAPTEIEAKASEKKKAE
jgi:hypothetical protein